MFTRAAALLRRKRSELAAWLGRAADNGEGTTMAIESKPDEQNDHVAGIRDAIQDLRWHSEKAYPITSVYGRLVAGFMEGIVAFFARLAD